MRTANRMLSNCVMPSLGPIQASLQMYLAGHGRLPHGNSGKFTVSFSEQRGAEMFNVTIRYSEDQISQLYVLIELILHNWLSAFIRNMRRLHLFSRRI